MNLDYDQIIRNIIGEWRNIPQEFDFKTRALERHVIPILYYQIRKEILKEKLVRSEKKFQKKFNQLTKTVIHIYWIMLWSIKWLVRPLPSNKKFMVCAVGSDRKLTFAYLQNLIEYAKEKNLSIISLNVICSRKILDCSEILYFPRFLYQVRYSKLIKKFSEDWYCLLEKLKEIVQNHIHIAVSFSTVHRFINDYSRDYFCVKNYLELFKDNIVFLIQDFDYTSNRNIYCELFKTFRIPTISLNHSILIYDHLYESVYCDYALVWGQHQKVRIGKLSELAPKKISVIGTPIDFARKERIDDTVKYWVYNLPSFESPAAETIHRSAERTLEMIEEINKIILNDKLNIKLFVNFHPNDSLLTLRKLGFNAKSISFSEILNYASLIFGEDSTIMIEMLKTEIPLIYITDDLQKDPFNFIFWKTAELSVSKVDLYSAIKKSYTNKPDLKKREEQFEYYFGSSKNFYGNLKHELDSIIR